MRTVRTFVRFSLAALFVNALAVACTVESSDDDSDSCDPGSTQSCDCSDGSEGKKKCNASGSGYGVCDCDDNGSGTGGSGGSGGSTNNGGDGNGTAGSVSPSAGAGGDGAGGDGAGGAAGSAGGMSSGGEAGGGGAAGSGGEGGSGDPTPAVCLNPADACEECYQVCCDEWVACTDDQTCPDQFFDILECTGAIRATRNVKVEDLAACADDVGTAGGGWSNGLTSQTVAMVNCLGGDPTTDSWSGEAVWGATSCNEACFKKPN
jgi:hypothetical protein